MMDKSTELNGCLVFYSSHSYIPPIMPLSLSLSLYSLSVSPHSVCVCVCMYMFLYVFPYVFGGVWMFWRRPCIMPYMMLYKLWDLRAIFFFFNQAVFFLLRFPAPVGTICFVLKNLLQLWCTCNYFSLLCYSMCKSYHAFVSNKKKSSFIEYAFINHQWVDYKCCFILLSAIR